MRTKQWGLFFSTLGFIGATIPMIMGAKILLYPLVKEPYFPFGNLLTAIGLIGFSGMFYFGIYSLYFPLSKREKIFSKLIKIAVALSILWIPVGYLLSGNLSNSFNGTDLIGSVPKSTLFWIYTYGIIVFPIVVVCSFYISKLFKNKPKPQSGLLDPREVLIVLRGIIYSGFPFSFSNGYYWDGRKTVMVEITSKGYSIRFFVDAGDLDYVDYAKAPDGREGSYDQWDNHEDLADPIDQLSYFEMRRLVDKFDKK